MRNAAALLLIAAALLACDEDPTGPVTERFGFEAGLAGWEAAGIGLDAPGVSSGVEAAAEAVEGAGSARLTLTAPGPGPMLWLERSIPLRDETGATVTVRFRVGTIDPPALDNWAAVVAVTTDVPPRVSGDVALPGFIRLPADQQPFGWVAFEHRFLLPPGGTRAYVAIGVAARGAGERSYLLDAVEVDVSGDAEVRALGDGES